MLLREGEVVVDRAGHAFHPETGTAELRSAMSLTLFARWLGVTRVRQVGKRADGGFASVQRPACKRPLSRVNVCDVVLTVALGSALASVQMSDNLGLGGGLAG